MRLSEAMRLGAMLRPQVEGVYFAFGGSCAIGAAIEATGGDIADEESHEAHIVAHFGWIDKAKTNCPACQDRDEVGCIITHLNDVHEWTRDRIADWVATIEPQEAQPESVDSEAARAGLDDGLSGGSRPLPEPEISVGSARPR